jgi:hypothetical protein
MRVYESDDAHTNGILVYTGVITRIFRKSEGGGEYVEVSCLGIATLLSFVYYQNNITGYNFSKTDTP